MQRVTNNIALEEMEVMRLWNVDDLAAYFGVSKRQARRYYLEGDLPYVDLGNVKRFRQEAVQAWAMAHERKH